MEEGRLLDNLCKVIDDDLAEIKASIARPGWSPWLLAATIAACISSSFDEFLKSGAELRMIAVAYLIARFAFDVPFFIKIIKSPAGPLDKTRVYVRSSTLSYLRPASLGGTLAACSGIGLSLWQLACGFFQFASFIGFYIGYAFILAALFVASYQKKYFRNDSDHSGNAWKLIFISLISASITPAYMALLGPTVSINPSALRIGVLLAVSSVLTQYWASAPKFPESYQELRNLKRELLLGQINPVIGQFKYKAISLGFQLSDLVFDHSITIFEGLEKIASEFEAALRYIEPFREAVDLELTASQREQLANRLHAAGDVGRVTDEIKLKLSGATESFNQLISTTYNISQEDLETLDPLVALLQQATQHSEKVKAEFDDLFFELRNFVAETETVPSLVQADNESSII